MASPPHLTERRARAAAPAAECDDVLWQIFLLLDSPADLVRACAASPIFRRIILDPLFLRRFRVLHPPPLLVVLSRSRVSRSYVFLPAEPPHPSAAGAHAFSAAGFSRLNHSSFLPSPGPWYYLDSCDGRDLLYADNHQTSSGYLHEALYRRLVVCDPLHRRYRELPPIPRDDIAPYVGPSHLVREYTYFLAPPAEDDDKEDPNFLDHPCGEEDDDDHNDDSSSSLPFRVMLLIQCDAKLVLFVFSSSASGGKGKWRAVMFHGWRALCDATPHGHLLVYYRNYAHGCFCWPFEDKLIVLDARRTTPEFSTISLPSYVSKHRTFKVVEAAGEEQKLGVFTIHENTEHKVYHLLYVVLQDSEGQRWEPEAIIYLPLRYHRYSFVGRGIAGGYLLLEGEPQGQSPTPTPDLAYFSLDLRSLQLEWFSGSKRSFFKIWLYAGFPPYLSPPMV